MYNVNEYKKEYSWISQERGRKCKPLNSLDQYQTDP